jgi:hypothetical protein
MALHLEARIFLGTGERFHPAELGKIIDLVVSFLKYAGELHIFVLSRRKIVPYKYCHLTSYQSLRAVVYKQRIN